MVTPTSKLIEVKNIFVRVNASPIYRAKISLDLSIWVAPLVVAMHFHALVGENWRKNSQASLRGFFEALAFSLQTTGVASNPYSLVATKILTVFLFL